MSVDHSQRERVLVLLLLAFVLQCLISPASAVSKDSCDCKWLEKLVDQGKVAPSNVPEILKFVEKNPNNSYGHLALAFYYESQGLTNPALQEYEFSYQLDRKNSRALLGEIRLQLGLKKYSEVDVLLNEAKSRFPEDPRFDYSKFFSLSIQGHEQDASSFLNEQLKAKPNSPELNLLKATVLASQKRVFEALYFCNLTLRENRSFFPGIILKKAVLTRLGRKQEAFQMLVTWFRDTPYNPLSCRFYLKFLADENRPELALEPTLALLALRDPLNPPEVTQAQYLATLALMKFPESLVQETLRNVTRKLSDARVSCELENSIGDIYDRLGCVNLALVHYRSALSIATPEMIAILRVANYAETRALDSAAAISEYSRVLNLCDSSQQQRVRTQIDRLKAKAKLCSNDPSWQLKEYIERLKTKAMSPILTTVNLAKMHSALPNPYVLLGFPTPSRSASGAQMAFGLGSATQRDQISP